MKNNITFMKSETIKISVYNTVGSNCPIFTIESDNGNSNISDIIRDTLKLY